MSENSNFEELTNNDFIIFIPACCTLQFDSSNQKEQSNYSAK